MLLVIGRLKTCPGSMPPAIFMTSPRRANWLPTSRPQVKGCTFPCLSQPVSLSQRLKRAHAYSGVYNIRLARPRRSRRLVSFCYIWYPPCQSPRHYRRIVPWGQRYSTERYRQYLWPTQVQSPGRPW